MIAAAIEDILYMEINPIYYKLSLGCILIGALITGNGLFANTIYYSVIFVAIGLAAYYLKIWGGGDAKLMYPTGAYIGYLTLPPYAYLMFFVFTAFMWLVLTAAITLLMRKKINRRIPFAPVFPISLYLAICTLTSLGF